MQDSRDQPKTSPALRRRLFWLLACTAPGLGIGLIGHAITSNPKWFLALPATLAAGWLFFANPEQCLAARREENAHAE